MDSNSRDLSRIFTKKIRGFDESNASKSIFKTPGRCEAPQRLNRTASINTPNGSMNFKSSIGQAQAEALMGPASKSMVFNHPTGKSRTSRPTLGKTECLFPGGTMIAKKHYLGYASQSKLPAIEGDSNIAGMSMDDLGNLRNRELKKKKGKHIIIIFFDWIKRKQGKRTYCAQGMCIISTREI